MDQSEKELIRKLITELHDISLSLRVLSQRDMTPPKKKTYAEQYFARSNPPTTE